MSKLDDRLKTIVMRFGWITEDDDWKQAVEDIKTAVFGEKPPLGNFEHEDIIGSVGTRVNTFKGDTELDKYRRLLRAVQDEINELEEL